MTTPSSAGRQNEILPARKSLAAWALFAVLLVFASYLFTLALAVACVYLPYLLTIRTGLSVQGMIAFLCGSVIAVIVLWSLIPRRDFFLPAGPVVTAAEQPRLFAEIEQIAKALKEPLPHTVYLLPDVNAWVALRGGIMGFGGRRVMGLGLPLLQILSVSEFRAVLGHEFGHYYAGDTRLGPWVYSARDAMVRTIQNVGDSDLLDLFGHLGMARLLHALVVLILSSYWHLYMRGTQLISRRQEYRSDELACSLAGPEALSSGLRRIAGASAAIQSFWNSHMTPAINAGCRMPMAEGFARFIESKPVDHIINAHLARELATPRTSPYASHPPLRDRLAAAASFRYQAQNEDRAPAMSLFDNVDVWELKLLEFMIPNLNPCKLRRVGADNLFEEVYVPSWRAFVAEYRDLLAGIRIQELVSVVREPQNLVARVRDPKGRLFTREQRLERALSLLCLAFIVTLLDHGWEPDTMLREQRLQRGEDLLNPYELVNEMRRGVMTETDWAARSRALGIAELRLAAAAASA